MFRRLPLHPLRLLNTQSLGCRHVSTAKPFYITTPIFYPNAVPHIGHLYSLLIADIYYRYYSLKDPSRAALFTTGTDEHGLKIQKAAQAKGLPPKEFCDHLSTHFRRLSRTANISYTRFIRTSEDAHEEAVRHIWRELDAQGLIYKGTYSGWYSITDECFYPDGAVSHIAGQAIATETSSPVEYTTETNYMFHLSAFRGALLDHYAAHPTAIFPQQHLADTLAILTEPLQDISISRPRARLSWGIAVPGDPEHTIYVWIDAVISYLTAIGYPWRDAENSGLSNGWPVDLQIIGKDIVRFHAIYLPAILLALKLPLQRRLLAHAHWTSSQKKMSKSLGNTTDPFDVMGTYGVDPVRYYMAIAGGNFRDDVDWSDAQVKKETTELRNILGNFLLRVTSSKIRGIIDGAREKGGVLEPAQDGRYEPLCEALKVLPGEVAKDLESLEVSDALKRIMEVVRLANKILTDVEPWNGDSPALTLASFDASVEALRVAGICLQPFIPDTAKRLLDALGVNEQERAWVYADKTGAGVGLVRGIKLFEK
ncbi:uncharacterized protein BT62DRAFT_930842 [Guyanagaster necrorhizus]|uniref:Probable methionine--tRNA ligase, mitochondrial n=1 Tax=Guyanagaster necrorhizus TaxID=856835 RepID=A0A9P8AVD3_9AGAR|nr:uncharacterized protein BT62DRAFT_930842 [Guyanagaster necrorhizus MCA 3950]KAG7447802.1 hypothetical protein BT62DRAFT_930842 [Guyanagaster necrorhizus MCA 3950]